MIVDERTVSNEKDAIELTHIAIKEEKDLREVEILKVNNVGDKSNRNRVGFFKLEYALAKRYDAVFFVVAVLGSIIAGASMPLISLLLGKVINNFNGSIDPAQVPSLIQGVIINFILAGLGIFIGSLLMVYAWTIIGKRLTNKINAEYFRVIMRQEQAWFDRSNMFEFATKVQTQVKIIENGIGGKVGLVISSVSQFCVSFLIGYITSWQLSLVITAMLPLLGLGGWCMAKAMEQGTANLKTYEKAGGMAEEVLYQIKTVASFANFEIESEKYSSYIEETMKKGIKMGFKAGFGIGFIIFVIYSSYALAVGYGSHLISSQAVNHNSGEKFGAGDVITVLFSIIFGCFSLGQAAPNLKAIHEACGAAVEFFNLRERVPQIELKNSILKPEKNSLSGKLEFNHVKFTYPQTDKIILEDINVNFEPGQKIAIVGHSGSGKSTILSLIERFYDPIDGQILLDGIDIRNFDINYWRSLIGYVPQEPVLFNTSIKSNIIFGREKVATDREVQEACEKAYATEFINNVGLDYVVGIKGSKLSGGQKQRIAIARAVLTKPKLLILDEATSALDNQSEKEVQKALDIVSKDITTIIIAHKIETIINSDKIICLDKGNIVEFGTHDELIKKGGFYSNLIHYKEEKQKEEEEEMYEEEELGEDDIVEEMSIDNKKNSFFDDSSNITANNENNKFQIHTDEIILEEKNKNVEPRITNPRSSNRLSMPGEKRISFRKSVRKSIIPPEPIREEVTTVDPKEYAQSRRKVLQILKEHKCFAAGAATAAALNGAVWPIYGILFADAIGVLSKQSPEEVSQGGLNVSMMFMALAISAALVLWMQNYFFFGIGEILTRKIRQQVFDKFLNFHMGFFDRPENSPGSLLTKLSSDTTKICGVATSVIGQLLQTLVTLILGITLALIYEWRLCLINICFLPLIIGSYVLQFRVQKGSSEGSDGIEVEVGSILSESVNNTKTIFSYNMQDQIVEFYAQKLKGFNKGMYKSTLWHGLLYSLSQFVVFIMYAVLFYIGGGLYQKGEATFQSILRAIFTVLFAALGVGVAQAFVGDYAAAQKAIVSLYRIIDEPSLIDVKESQTKGIKKASFEGRIEFKNVKFHYPNQRKLIFDNLSFVIQPGQNVAFVGASGSGKSTIISLIERFYDVADGEVLIDGVNIKDYDLKLLRKHIGIVLQEPALFKRSIRENILYGRLDASNEEVEQAARDANIYEKLIQSDNKLVTVSGGEKQRIAIARAILKNPTILLLDEATSALDRESEMYVKESLSKLMKNRTSVVVAHRLSTIVGCDVIFYLEKGKIVESGTHDQLIALKGKYFDLYNGSMG